MKVAYKEVNVELSMRQYLSEESVRSLFERIPDREVKEAVMRELKNRRDRELKVANNGHRVKLRWLLSGAGKVVPPSLQRSANCNESLTMFGSKLLDDTGGTASPIRGSPAAAAAVPETPGREVGPPRYRSTPARHSFVNSRREEREVPAVGSSSNVAENIQSIGSSSTDSGNSRRRNRKFVPRSRFRRLVRRKTRTPVKNLWTNYSTHVVTPEQAKFLNLGLNFCELPKKFNRTEVEASLLRWERSMRWKEYWYKQRQQALATVVEEEEEEEEEEREVNTRYEDRIFKDKEIKTNLPRNHPVPAALANCISATRYAILSSPLNQSRPNISPEIRAGGQDLVTLQREKVLMVKPSDKAGGYCLMDFADYKEEMEEKLKEKFVDTSGELKDKYVQIQQKELKKQWEEVKEVVSFGINRGYITPEDGAIMVPEKPSAGRLYGNVKDHKPVAAGKNIPKLREIVSGSGSNTEWVSAYVDHHAKPEVQKLPSYIEDTPDVLRKIAEKNRRGPLPPNAIPVVMDVTALYPNVPHEEGLTYLERALDRRTDKSVPTDFLIRLMRLVLTKNTFEWDRKLFIQKDGTAIGTRAAPTYAGLFMGGLEADALQAWLEHAHQFNLEDWLRFIDDIWFWWTGTEEELLQFIDFMNNFHPTIKFTCEYDFQTRSVNFLDMKIYVDSDGYIQTDLYTKPNTKCQYLLPSSNHPSHVTKNIPYSLAFRLRRICSTEERFNIRLGELRDLLLERGYRRRVIEAAFEKVKQLERATTLSRVVREKKEDRVKAIFKFDKRLPDISGIMKRNYEVMVADDKRLKNVFGAPPMVCYSRGRNNRELLCRAKLPVSRGTMVTRQASSEDGFRRCGKGCSMCPYTRAGLVKTITISSTGEQHPITGQLTCDTENCLYIGTCVKGDRTCPDRPQYLGETGQRAKDRCASHVGTIRQDCHQNTVTPVGQHFRGRGHSAENFEFTPFEKIYSKDPYIRKIREKYWINKFNMIDAGLNKKL